MNGMSDEFDTTQDEFDAMFATGTPVEVRGPIVPCGAIIETTRSFAVAATLRQNVAFPEIRTAITAAV